MVVHLVVVLVEHLLEEVVVLLLQVDQVVFAYREALREFRECSEVGNLDSSVDLCARCLCQKATQL